MITVAFLLPIIVMIQHNVDATQTTKDRSMRDEMYYVCPICCAEQSEFCEWIEPHEMARRMPDSERYVCSNECATHWIRSRRLDCEEYDICKLKSKMLKDLEDEIAQIKLKYRPLSDFN